MRVPDNQLSNKKVYMADKWMQSLGSTRGPPRAQQNAWVNTAGNIPLTIQPEDRPGYTDYEESSNDKANYATRKSNPFEFGKSKSDLRDQVVSKSKFIDLNEDQQDDIVLGSSRNPQKKLGQTTQMADGQTVLFPDLYTNMYGVKELDSETKVGSSMFEHSQVLMHQETFSVDKSAKRQSSRPKKER